MRTTRLHGLAAVYARSRSYFCANQNSPGNMAEVNSAERTLEEDLLLALKETSSLFPVVDLKVQQRRFLEKIAVRRDSGNYRRVEERV